MIAGLLSNNAQNTIDKTPGAGDLPILGALFNSTEFQKGQTELVIVVTPYLVEPVDDSRDRAADRRISPRRMRSSSGSATTTTTGAPAAPDRCRARRRKRPPPQVSVADQPADVRRLPGEGEQQRRSGRARLQHQVRKVIEMPIRSKTAVTAAIALSLGLALSGCGDLPNNQHAATASSSRWSSATTTRSISRPAPAACAIPEQKRLADWFETMDLGYGDRVALDGSITSQALREDVAAIASRHGMLLSEGAPPTDRLRRAQA